MQDIKVLGLALALSLSAFATAQSNILVVDGQNGPGTDFTDLPPAIAAAAPGTILRVRPGTYTGIGLQKGVHILGEGTVVLGNLAPGAFSTFSLNNLPAGQTFSMRNVTIGQGLALPNLQFNAGRVLLDGVQSGPLSIVSCSQVELQDCAFPFRVNTAKVSCVGHSASTPFLSIFNSPPILLESGADLVLSNCFVTGPAGVPAVSMANADLSVSNRAGGTFLAAGGGVLTPVPVISGAGSVRLDPSTVLTPRGGAPAISGPQVLSAAQPIVQTEGSAVGGTFVTEIFGPGLTPYLVLFGFPGNPTPIPSVGGELWVRDPAILSSGVFPITGSVQSTSFVPALPILIGVPVARQVLSLDGQGGLQLSNAASYVIRP